MTEDEKNIIRETFQRIKEKSEDDFEKYITYISAGGLGLSLTFIEKVIPFEKSIALWSLVLAWAFLTLTLLVNLFSHFYSKKLIDRSIDDIDNNVPDLNEKIDSRNRNIDRVNIGTIITLIIGIGLIVFFISLNAQNIAKQNKSESEKTHQIIMRKNIEEFDRTNHKQNGTHPDNKISKSDKKS